MAQFQGVMDTNQVYNTLHNGFEYVETVADKLSGLSNSVADKYRVDAGPYGTDLVYTDFDLIKSYEFDKDDTNVLAVGDKVTPVQEFIRMDKVRQINLYQPTEFLAKLAWMSEGSWSQFNGVVASVLHDTKTAYNYLLGMTGIGTLESNVGKQSQVITLPTAPADNATNVEKEAYARRCGQIIGQKLEDIIVEACDLGKNYNDYGFRKSFKREDFDFVYNVNAINKIANIDMPMVFNEIPGLKNIKGEKIQSLYFGRALTVDDIGAGKVIGEGAVYDNTKGTLRSKVEKDLKKEDGTIVHVFPGDELPNGIKVLVTLPASGKGALIAETYFEDDTILCKAIHKKAIKYMTGFASDSEFWNPKNHSSNKYTTWMFAEPKKISSYPLITIRLANSN